MEDKSYLKLPAPGSWTFEDIWYARIVTEDRWLESLSPVELPAPIPDYGVLSYQDYGTAMWRFAHGRASAPERKQAQHRNAATAQVKRGRRPGNRKSKYGGTLAQPVDELASPSVP